MGGCYGYIVTVDRSCTFGNALVSIGTSSTGSSPPSALYSFAYPELAIIHKANTVSTTGDLLLLLTSHLQGLPHRCSGSTTELGTDREAAIIRLVAVLCRPGPWHLPLCTMHAKLRVLPHEWLETTRTHIDIRSASIPSLPFRNRCCCCVPNATAHKCISNATSRWVQGERPTTPSYCDIGLEWRREQVAAKNGVNAVCGRPAGSSKLVPYQAQVIRFELSVDHRARRRAPDHFI